MSPEIHPPALFKELMNSLLSKYSKLIPVLLRVKITVSIKKLTNCASVYFVPDELNGMVMTENKR